MTVFPRLILKSFGSLFRKKMLILRIRGDKSRSNPLGPYLFILVSLTSAISHFPQHIRISERSTGDIFEFVSTIIYICWHLLGKQNVHIIYKKYTIILINNYTTICRKKNNCELHVVRTPVPRCVYAPMFAHVVRQRGTASR